jgi:hypothetical protein
LRLKFSSSRLCPLQNNQILGVYFYFFHFSFWKLCSLAMLLSSGHKKRFPLNKFIGINMALGRSWINYLYTMRWWLMQRSWGDHLFKYGGTLISKYSLEAPYNYKGSTLLTF